MITAKTKYTKKITKQQFDKFEDRVIYNIADIVLHRSSSTIPWLTGHMYGDIYARGVKGQNKLYSLGVDDTEYAIYVWNMKPNTHWTNPSSKPRWFLEEFETYTELIINQAVKKSEKVIE